MTPIHWRRAEPRDAAALSLLGGATFLASFAYDHPGDALMPMSGPPMGRISMPRRWPMWARWC